MPMTAEQGDDPDDRAEWDRLWSSTTQRSLPSVPKVGVKLSIGSSPVTVVEVTISADPNEFSDRVWRQSDVCPVCGQSTAGETRLATSLDVILENGLMYGVGVWTHRSCFERCPDTGVPAPIPW